MCHTLGNVAALPPDVRKVSDLPKSSPGYFGMGESTLPQIIHERSLSFAVEINAGGAKS